MLAPDPKRRALLSAVLRTLAYVWPYERTAAALRQGLDGDGELGLTHQEVSGVLRTLQGFGLADYNGSEWRATQAGVAAVVVLS